MTDNVAVLAGFTREVTAENSQFTLDLLVQPGTDFDDTFKAWDLTEQEFILVNGWMFEIVEGEGAE